MKKWWSGAKGKAARKRWRVRHPANVKAHHVVAYAKKSGRLTQQPCEVCGNPRSEAHHPDYMKPLDVVWLCQCHHLEEHLRERRGS